MSESSPVTELEALADELLSLSDVEQSFGRNYNRDVMRRAQVALRRHAQSQPNPDFHPGKCLPDCMMPDGGECCPGYIALYDAYWHLIRSAPAQCAPGVKMSEVELARHFLRIVVSDRNDQADVIDSARDFLTKFDVTSKASTVTSTVAPAQCAEPVAWRWQVHGIWHYTGGYPVSGAEPLYLRPSLSDTTQQDASNVR